MMCDFGYIRGGVGVFCFFQTLSLSLSRVSPMWFFFALLSVSVSDLLSDILIVSWPDTALFFLSRLPPMYFLFSSLCLSLVF